MSRFDLAAGVDSSATTPAYANSPYATDDDDEEDNLPYPTELPRSDFLKPDFDPQEYLSSLRNRHQALEDLRSDLRSRSQLLNQELLDLVNGNYEEFLSLGSDLNGGEEKVEGVRIGLLGFTKEIEALKTVVSAREGEFGGLLSEAKQVRREIVSGRKLLEFEDSLELLEDSLGINGLEEADEDSELNEELDEENGDVSDAVLARRRLARRTEQYSLVEQAMDTVPSGQPFVDSLRPRMETARKTLLLDISSALRQAKAAGDSDGLLDLSRLFSELKAASEAIQILKAK